MLTYKEKSLEVKRISAEERKKEERMRDVTLLLQQIVEREEVALKLIIDCLIDVGSINYANTKLPNPSLNKIMKVLVGYLKPIARMIALGWVKKNLPNLLTAWLEAKVSFKPIPLDKDTAITGKLETVPNTEEETVTSRIEAAPFKESLGD
jgi:hypothetical protein